ncbi:MAG: EAL domain-containing protein [Oscillospiraceae bacterium]
MSEPKKRHLKSVQHNIMYTVIIAMIALLLAFSVIVFLLARVRTENSSLSTMTNSAAVVSGIVKDYMSPKIETVKNAANDKLVADFLGGKAESEQDIKNIAEYNDINSMLSGMSLANSDVVSSWIIFESDRILISDNGTFINSDALSLNEIYWYNDIMLRGLSEFAYCTSVSESLIYPDRSVISVISPVYASENIIGFVGMEIEKTGIEKILEQYTFNSSCYPIITCNYGSIVYSPSSSDFTGRYDIKSAPLLNILVQSSSLNNGIDNYANGINSKTFYNVDKSVVPNWDMIIIFDKAAIDGEVYSICFWAVIVLVCLLVLVVIWVRNKVKNEVSVLTKIKESVDNIASDNFKYVIDTSAVPDNNMITTAEKLNKISTTLAAKNEIILQYSLNDTLTGIPNRNTLYYHLESIISRNKSSETISDGRFAVMFVDLDNFKWLNENLGHNFGDAVLCTFATMLSTSLSKIGRVFRFSGDEFIVIVEFGDNYQKIYKAIETMQSVFSKQIKVMSDNIYIKFSVGVSIYPDDDDTADMLLRDADMALHKAKDSGKDRVSFYTNAAKRQNFSKAAISQQISEAIKNGELYLNYQPIISSDTCDIHGFEVLVRWDSPIFGHIPPQEFINVAEETGDIVQIGMWIFENACRFLKNLCENYRDDIIMSINVSPIQLKRADFLDSIKHVIEITQLDTKNIQIEITESTLIDFIDNDNSVIEEMNKMGISLALDDFGTGYSSLNYLKNFPIKCLKIDKSFVDEINNNERDQAITDSIIDLVHNLGIKTVAEGIETVGQYNFLKDMKCDYIQGFLMSKPLNEEDALEFVERYDDLHKPDKNIMEEHEKQLAVERDNKLKQKQQEQEKNEEKRGTELVDGIISK